MFYKFSSVWSLGKNTISLGIPLSQIINVCNPIIHNKFALFINCFSLISFCIHIISVLKGFSLLFQSNSLPTCEVPWKIDECCAVIDAFTMVPSDAMNRLKGALKEIMNVFWKSYDVHNEHMFWKLLETCY